MPTFGTFLIDQRTGAKLLERLESDESFSAEQIEKEDIDPFEEMISHAVWITDGVPQVLHAYGLELA